MGTGSQDLFGFGDFRIGELFGREISPHELAPFDDASGIQNPARVEAFLYSSGERCQRSRLRFKNRNGLV
jgi:hypothetical protein